MQFPQLAVVGLAGLLTLGQAPMSTAPDAPISLAPGTLVFSTQNQQPYCVRRAGDCTFRQCCRNAGYCRNTRNNGKRCR